MFRFFLFFLLYKPDKLYELNSYFCRREKNNPIWFSSSVCFAFCIMYKKTRRTASCRSCRGGYDSANDCRTVGCGVLRVQCSPTIQQRSFIAILLFAIV